MLPFARSSHLTPPFQRQKHTNTNKNFAQPITSFLFLGKRLSLSDRKHSTAKEDSDEDLEDDETAEESDGEDTEEKREKRAQKELKTLAKKLQSFKNKEDNARKERLALREIIKKNQTAIKEEKKKYKQLKKEVSVSQHQHWTSIHSDRVTG